MGISEFTVHNVLRTYSRQEGIGRAQKARPPVAGATRSSDQVTLSPTAKKAQWLGQLAAEVVDGQDRNLPPEERAARIREAKDELLSSHKDEVRNDGLTPEVFEARLRQQHLG